MPIRRRFAPKSKLIRRKRLARPMKRMPMVKSIRQPQHYFKRSNYLSGWTVNSTSADTLGSIFFTLSGVPNFSEFTSLYDQYRINGVKITIIPRGNQSDIGTASGTVAQSVGVFSVIDYDDNGTPANLNALLQYQNMKMTRSHQQHHRYLKPRILNTVAGNASATYNAGSVRGWLDVIQSDVPHFGIKYCLQQSPNSVQTFDLKIDYYLAFKNVR